MNGAKGQRRFYLNKHINSSAVGTNIYSVEQYINANVSIQIVLSGFVSWRDYSKWFYKPN